MPPINEKPPEQPNSADNPIHAPLPPESRKAFDARQYLERTLQRRPGEMLKIVRIPHTNSYRVNWYNPSTASASIPGLSTMYIRESKFLFCSLGPDGEPKITYPARQ